MKSNTWWMQITSGRGPVECCWVVGQLIPVIRKEAQTLGFQAEIIKAIPGPERETYKSILLAISGHDQSFKKSWEGTVLWIGRSKFRPQHKRKNWYVGVKALLPPASSEWSEKNLKFETMRASGPGGQHVNKTESAVRVTHLPTGIQIKAKEERSQRMNRQLALARLADLLSQRNLDAKEQAQKDRWQAHNELERGNPIRIFTGPDLRPANTRP